MSINMEINLRNLFQDFNPSKFVVYTALLFFSLLFGLKQDGFIHCHYFLIFIPLWIWKIIAITGGIIGCAIHVNHPPSRSEIGAETEYRAMIMSLLQHFLLLSFEIAACVKLDLFSESDSLKWIYVSVPLLLLSLVAMIICIWSVRRERTFEFELFFSVCVLQFIFLALKMDNYIGWSWVIVFVPIWVLICLSLIGVLYAIVLAVLLIRSIELLPEHRRQHVYTAIGYTFLVVPILIFLILLTSKLDRQSGLPYIIVFTPLYLSLICLVLMACGTKGGNQWWFGLRRDFCQFLLDSCSCIRQYGNVTFRFSGHVPIDRAAERAARIGNHTIRDMKPIVPAVSIECPD